MSYIRCSLVVGLAMLLLPVLLGCQSTGKGSASMGKLTTSVFYRERVMLPPGAMLSVTLEDVSKMDVAAELIAWNTVQVGSAPPYEVVLRYDPARIQERMRYGVRARIEHNGKLLFTSTRHIDPFANDGDEPVEILVERVRTR